MVLKDTGSDRRRFLGGLLATAAVLPGGAVLAQGFDPYTGQPLYGGPPTDRIRRPFRCSDERPARADCFAPLLCTATT